MTLEKVYAIVFFKTPITFNFFKKCLFEFLKSDIFQFLQVGIIKGYENSADVMFNTMEKYLQQKPQPYIFKNKLDCKSGENKSDVT